MKEWDIVWKQEYENSFDKTNKQQYGSFKTIENIVIENKYNDVIELGCGSGLTTLYLAKKMNFRPYLLDNSDNALNFAQTNAELLKIDAMYIKGNALTTPFRDNSFDIVWSGGLNEHFKDDKRQKIFNEMARITKSGGICLITVPNKRYLPLNLYRHVATRQGTWAFGYEEPFTKQELKKRMQDAGLRDIEIYSADFCIGFHYIFTLIPLLAGKCNLDNPFYRKIWNVLQQIDQKVAFSPGLIHIAYSKKI